MNQNKLVISCSLTVVRLVEVTPEHRIKRNEGV